MTTISSNRRKRRISRRTAAFLIIVVVLLSVTFLWRSAATNFLWHLVTPALTMRSEAQTASGGFFAQFASNSALAAENTRLKEALASTSALLADRNFLYSENLDLKRRLNRNGDEKVILGTVIMRPPMVPYGVLVIDAGSREGVNKDDLVAAAGSAYIGRVTDVYDTSSRITLFSAPGQSYQALLRGTVPLALEGEGSGSMQGELPVGVSVAVGDPVLLPSIMPEFAARVSAVIHEEGQSFQSVYLALPVNPLELRFVEVHAQKK